MHGVDARDRGRWKGRGCPLQGSDARDSEGMKGFCAMSEADLRRQERMEGG